MTTPQQLPLPEMAEYLRSFEDRCTVRNWLAAKLHVRVLRDICADLVGWVAGLARSAHAAECDDAEAERLVSDVLADGRLTQSDLPLLRRALKHIHNSREHDHNLAEKLSHHGK